MVETRGRKTDSLAMLSKHSMCYSLSADFSEINCKFDLPGYVQLSEMSPEMKSKNLLENLFKKITYLFSFHRPIRFHETWRSMKSEQ